MKCYVCGDEAIQRHGRANLCAKHRRFVQMQKAAKHDGKYIPSLFEIEKITPSDMICQDCGVLMNWIDESNRAATAVLQHYCDGTLGVTCFSCNTKHGHMAGDSYRDLPHGHKLCGACKTIKPLSEFAQRKDGKKPYPMTKCKVCNLEANKKWRTQNPERYRSLNKKHNDLKKLNPDKYREFDRKSYHKRKEASDSKDLPI